jgi:hypothetical protein|tara:strand:+ start:545 stop:787 length:243 start_codon:yes stop_codon:yes gene_type:complete
MSNIKVDYPQISINSISSTDTVGADYQFDAFIIPISIPIEEVSSLLSGFDIQDVNSPDITISRELARIILSALYVKVNED